MEKAWSSTTKRIILIGSVVALFLLVTRISSILPPLIITLVLAYILTPIANFVSARLRLNRTLVVVIIYLILIAVIIIVPALLIPPLIIQIENFAEGLPDIIEELDAFIEKPLVFYNFSVDLEQVFEEVSATLESSLSSLATRTVNILSNVATVLIWTVFILMASFYLVKDSAHILQWLDEVVPPPYRQDFRLLKSRIAATWNAFLRGQLILNITMAIVVGTTMALIGLPYAWLIGLLFGALEFIPNLGPTIASVPTVLIAFFRGSNVLDITNGWFAVLVIGVNFALQQLENNILVPRIMGQSLNLHPLVVLSGAIIGARVAGVLGILLAAPAIATLRVLAEYVYHRLLDMPPFPEQQEEQRQTAASTTAVGPETVDEETPPEKKESLPTVAAESTQVE